MLKSYFMIFTSYFCTLIFKSSTNPVGFAWYQYKAYIRLTMLSLTDDTLQWTAGFRDLWEKTSLDWAHSLWVNHSSLEKRLPVSISRSGLKGHEIDGERSDSSTLAISLIQRLKQHHYRPSHMYRFGSVKREFRHNRISPTRVQVFSWQGL